MIRSYQKDDIDIDMLFWPLSTIRLKGYSIEKLVSLANQFLTHWQSYSNEPLNIRAHTNDEPHHTITPITRKKGSLFELDLVLRDNQTSEKHPLGIFHPHEDKWHIKKENIGLIEAMGLAILPKRLIKELDEVKAYLTDQKPLSEQARIHQSWIDQIEDHLDLNQLDESLRQAVGQVFEKVLEDCGVFKLNQEGSEAFDAFIKEVLT